MNLPVDSIRQAVYNALNGNVGLTVYSWPSKTATDYVLIGDIFIREITAQTRDVFEASVTIETITRTIVRDDTRGTKKTAATAAALVDAKMRPGVITFLSVTGYTVAGCYLDDQSEDLSLESDEAIFRISQTYFLRLFKN